jgi:6-phosphogluconolactonase
MMHQNSIHIFKDKQEIAHAFEAMIASGIRRLAGDSCFSVFLSGGSSPREVFEYLSTAKEHFIDWSKVRIFWGDERCIPPDHQDSNFKMAKEALLDRIAIPASNIYRIKGEEDPESQACEYETLVSELVPSVNGIPAADLFMLGLGSDGHTASIFPDNLAQFSSRSLFIPSINPISQQLRISATGTLINQSKNVVFMATGAAKAARVAQIIEKQPGWEQLPAAHVNPRSGNLFWMLDQEAAGLLKPPSPPSSGLASQLG